MLSKYQPALLFLINIILIRTHSHATLPPNTHTQRPTDQVRPRQVDGGVRHGVGEISRPEGGRSRVITHTHALTHTHTHTHAHTYMFTQHKHTLTRTHMHAHLHIHSLTRTHTCGRRAPRYDGHTHAHQQHTHTNIHTHIIYNTYIIITVLHSRDSLSV
jgi:hypothetical protein